MTPAHPAETRQARRAIALATFLTLVPLTLVVAGLHELIIVHLGGSRADAHAFTATNMATGIVGVPIAMMLFRRRPNLQAWLVGSLASPPMMATCDPAGSIFASWLAARLPAATLSVPM